MEQDRLDIEELQKRILDEVEELRDISVSIEKTAHKYVEADNKYRLCKAESYLCATGKTIPEKEAQVEVSTSELRFSAHSYEAQLQSLKELRKTIEQTISVYQTVINIALMEQNKGF